MQRRFVGGVVLALVLGCGEKAKKPPVDLRKYFLPRYDPELSTEDVLTRAKALRDEQAARRQGRLPEREAWEDINEMRDERSEEI